MDCIFCKIISGEIPKEFTYQTDRLVVFPDINPSARVHLLIVPKQHIRGIGEVGEKYTQLLAAVYTAINKLVLENNLTDDLYRVVVNGGKAQHVPHLHFHLLGGQWKKYV